jgi:serine/threonine-protein phosphatase 2A regulatory subunit B'
MKGFKKTLVSHLQYISFSLEVVDASIFLIILFILFLTVTLPPHQQLSRGKSSSESSSSKTSKNPTPVSNGPTPPPPPAKPSPASSTSSIQSFGNATSNVASSSSIGRSNPPPQQSGPQQPNVDRRNPAQDNYTPPIVVVSPEMPSDPLPHQKPTPHLPGEPATPPRATTTLNNRLRQAPKDTIPMVGKPPRKQRSSRFHVTEKVEIERLPAFNGMYILGSLVSI